jgi:hypothetical protein
VISLIVSVCVIALLVRAHRSVTLLIVLSLPATVAHELSHWVVALVLGASPKFPSVVPRRELDGSWTLGSVQFLASRWTAGVIALAPLLLLAPVAVWGLWFRPPGSLGVELGCGLVFGYVAWGAAPSSTDWGVSLRYPLGTMLALTVLAGFAGSVLGV